MFLSVNPAAKLAALCAKVSQRLACLVDVLQNLPRPSTRVQTVIFSTRRVGAVCRRLKTSRETRSSSTADHDCSGTTRTRAADRECLGQPEQLRKARHRWFTTLPDVMSSSPGASLPDTTRCCCYYILLLLCAAALASRNTQNQYQHHRPPLSQGGRSALDDDRRLTRPCSLRPRGCSGEEVGHLSARLL